MIGIGRRIDAVHPHLAFGVHRHFGDMAAHRFVIVGQGNAAPPRPLAMAYPIC